MEAQKWLAQAHLRERLISVEARHLVDPSTSCCTELSPFGAWLLSLLVQPQPLLSHAISQRRQALAWQVDGLFHMNKTYKTMMRHAPM
jgi:hypothetical protein